MTALAALAHAGCASSSRVSAGSRTATSTPPTSAAPASVAATASRDVPGPERIPLEAGPELASAFTGPGGNTVDGIKCAPVEQVAYHIHAHLLVYVNGQPRALPGGIGLIGPVEYKTPFGPFFVAQRCYYWLHRHAYDGVIHIESPTVRMCTLGDFFDEWGQPLSSHQVAGAKGAVTAFLNGRLWTKSPRSIPLLAHTVIQVDLGPPVPFTAMSWAGAKL